MYKMMHNKQKKKENKNPYSKRISYEISTVHNEDVMLTEYVYNIQFKMLITKYKYTINPLIILKMS